MATAIGAYATATLMKELAGITSSEDDTLIGKICDRVNQYIESRTRQVIAPITSGTYLYDGNGLKHLFLPLPTDETTLGVGGARAVSLVEFAPETNGTFETIAATDYFLRQRHGVAGPYRWLVISDKPAGSYHSFPEGYANVRLTMTAGWTAIPDDLTETALVIAQRAWNARQVGFQDVTGVDEMGQPTVARFVSGRDKETLNRYTLRAPV